MLIACCRGRRAIVGMLIACGRATCDGKSKRWVELGFDGVPAVGKDGVVAWRYTNRWIVSGARDPAAARSATAVASRSHSATRQGSQATREHGDVRQQSTCVSAPRQCFRQKYRDATRHHRKGPRVPSLRRLHFHLTRPHPAPGCSACSASPDIMHARNCTVFTRSCSVVHTSTWGMSNSPSSGYCDSLAS